MKYYGLISEGREDGLLRLIAKEDLPQFGVKKGDKGGLIHPNARLFDTAAWWAYESATFWGGTFMGGTFWGGTFWGGKFRGGEFRGGEFMGGEFMGQLDFLFVGPIGSRGRVTTFTRSDNKVRCGCFYGTMEEFEAKVNSTYPEGIHGDEYRAAIALAKIHFSKVQ